MQEATESSCLEELNPQSSGQAVAQEDGDSKLLSILTSTVYCLAIGEADRNNKLHVNFVNLLRMCNIYSIAPYSVILCSGLQGPLPSKVSFSTFSSPRDPFQAKQQNK